MEKHFCTCVHIYNPQTGKFLLVKHKKLGVWLQPGGHIDPNEDPEESALREVYEETGLTVKLLGERLPTSNDFIPPFAIQRDFIDERHNHLHLDMIYISVPTGSLELVENLRETAGIQWFTLSEIIDPDFETFDSVRYWSKYITSNYKRIANFY